ncbi:MAG: transcription initiation factor IIB [Thermoplasmata archaeon]|nr:transcription initiation factor IIB [Thermoplasmata archaeon]
MMFLPKSIKACPECGSVNIVHDYLRGDTLCGSCGLVLSELEIDHGPEQRMFEPEDTSLQRTGAPMTVMLHDRGLSTELGFPGRGNRRISRDYIRRFRSLKKWQQRSAFKTSAERNLMMGLRDISRMASVLGLPPSVKETAAVMHRQAVRKRLIIGRSTFGMATASVYAACRMCGVPRTIEEIAGVSQLNDTSKTARREVARSYRVLARALHLGLETPTPFDFVDRLISKLELSRKVRSRVIEILKIASDRGISVGKSPVSITAAAIYIASREIGERCRQKEIARAAGVTEVTVRNRYKELVKKLKINLPKD